MNLGPNTHQAGFLKSVEAARAAVEIVRALAAKEAPMDDEFGYCKLCTSDVPKYGWSTAQDLAEHDESCTWRLAREWVEANPE